MKEATQTIVQHVSDKLTEAADMTRGERQMRLAYLTTAAFGMAMTLLVLLRLDSTMLFQRGMTLYEMWVLCAGAAGAALALYVVRDRFGRESWVHLAIGIVVVTFLAPIIAGTLALPLYGTMFGPFTLAIIFAAAPTTAMLWLLNLIGVHLLMRSWMVERESIFGPPEPLIPRAVRQWWADLRSEGF